MLFLGLIVLSPVFTCQLTGCMMRPTCQATVTMADRRTEILEAAIALIVDEGYSSLTMRALAREVGMKLASLQYHFRTTDELMQGVVNHIGDTYDQSFEALRRDSEVITARQVVGFILEDEPGKAICGDRCGRSFGRCRTSSHWFLTW